MMANHQKIAKPFIEHLEKFILSQPDPFSHYRVKAEAGRIGIAAGMDPYFRDPFLGLVASRVIRNLKVRGRLRFVPFSSRCKRIGNWVVVQ